MLDPTPPAWVSKRDGRLERDSPAMLDDLSNALDTIERERPAGVIFASAKAKSFNAGADLFEIRKRAREQVSEYIARGPAVFDRVAKLQMPTIAASRPTRIVFFHGVRNLGWTAAKNFLGKRPSLAIE